MTTRIVEIEKLLGFGIEETDVCLRSPLNVGQVCTQAYNDFHKGFPSVCSLWNPIVFIYGSHILTNPHVKWDGHLADLVKPKTQRSFSKPGCGVAEKYVLPKLSARERAFTSVSNWLPGMCWFDTNDASLAEIVRRKYNKLSVANTSGHTLLHMEYARMFYTGVEEDRAHFERVMLAACIMWMVPYDHSIHEILTAARIMDVFPEYDYRMSSKDSLAILIDTINPRLKFTQQGGGRCRHKAHLIVGPRGGHYRMVAGHKVYE